MTIPPENCTITINDLKTENEKIDEPARITFIRHDHNGNNNTNLFYSILFSYGEFGNYRFFLKTIRLVATITNGFSQSADLGEAKEFITSLKKEIKIISTHAGQDTDCRKASVTGKIPSIIGAGISTERLKASVETRTEEENYVIQEEAIIPGGTAKKPNLTIINIGKGEYITGKLNEAFFAKIIKDDPTNCIIECTASIKPIDLHFVCTDSDIFFSSISKFKAFQSIVKRKYIKQLYNIPAKL